MKRAKESPRDPETSSARNRNTIKDVHKNGGISEHGNSVPSHPISHLTIPVNGKEREGVGTAKSNSNKKKPSFEF
jgi:hypothetical protein